MGYTEWSEARAQVVAAVVVAVLCRPVPAGHESVVEPERTKPEAHGPAEAAAVAVHMTEQALP